MIKNLNLNEKADGIIYRKLYRVMSEDEYNDVVQNGEFRSIDRSLEGKQFGCVFDEMVIFSKEMLKFDKKNLLIIQVEIPESIEKDFDYSLDIDAHIFKGGVFTIQEEQLPLFNEKKRRLKIVHQETYLP